MADYVIRRNKIRMFFWWLVITGIAVVFSLLTLACLVDGSLAPLDKWVGILLFAFVVITSTWASMAIAGQLVFGSSEFLKLTQEGFYYTGHGLGRKVYTASWQEVDRIFIQKLYIEGVMVLKAVVDLFLSILYNQNVGRNNTQSIRATVNLFVR